MLTIQDAYSFEKANSIFELPGELKEISGITLFDDEHLAAVQDERGRIYKIHFESGEVTDEDRFGDDGDYEDLVRIGDTFFILESDGDLYEGTGWPVNKDDTQKYETILKTRHDTEGLAYDAANNRLLISCKEYPGKGYKNKKAIYSFDLEKKEVDPEPAYLIDLKAIETLKPDHPLNQAIRRFMSPLTDLSGFKPSALAIHPSTQHIFVVSSVRKLLIAIDEQASIKAIWELSEESFPQPEGLAFLPNGDLFISNEGDGNKATLLRFNYNAIQDSSDDK